MASDFQTVSIIGSLGKDPETRALPKGGRVVTFSVGVGSGFGDGAYTEWFNVSAFESATGRGKEQLDRIEKYFKKGKKVAITGKLKTRSWDDKESGQKKYRTELIAEISDFFGGDGAKSDAPRTATRQERATPAPTPRAQAPADPFAGDIADDDIPF